MNSAHITSALNGTSTVGFVRSSQIVANYFSPLNEALAVFPKAVCECYYSDTIYAGNIMRVELVTTLKRQATKILSELHSSKEPVLITEHGQPSAYLVDVDDFEFMQKRMQILEALAKGEQAISRGETLSNIEAKEKMNKWLK